MYVCSHIFYLSKATHVGIDMLWVTLQLLAMFTFCLSKGTHVGIDILWVTLQLVAYILPE